MNYFKNLFPLTTIPLNKVMIISILHDSCLINSHLFVSQCQVHLELCTHIDILSASVYNITAHHSPNIL